MPLISVILPVYNGEKFIEEAVQSILDQTFEDFELIIINDASTDGTLEVLEKFSDARIRIETNSQNLKVVKCLNKGIKLSNGELIARMDADDIAYPKRFEKQVQYLRQHLNVDICGSWVEVFDGAYTIYKPYEKHDDIKASLLFVNNLIHPSVMFRKSSLLNNDLAYDESFINAEDYGLWIEAIDKWRFANVQEVLLKYRLHANNVSFFRQDIPSDIRAMNIKAYKTIFTNMGLPFSQADLDIHINFGLKRIKDLSRKSIIDSLKWLQLIVSTNNRTNYFNEHSLRNVIMHQLFYLVKKVKAHPGLYPEILKTIVKLYSTREYLRYIKFIAHRKLQSGKKLNVV